MLWSHLEFFLATARHGTLSAAAKELDVNHTTVARRIGSLEKEFQVKLFKRKNTGYALTEHGANLLAEVRNIEEMINQTKSKFNFFGNCIECLNLIIGSIHLKTYKTLALILYLINPLD